MSRQCCQMTSESKGHFGAETPIPILLCGYLYYKAVCIFDYYALIQNCMSMCIGKITSLWFLQWSLWIIMIRVVTFMRVTYPHIFEIRVKSIEFNEKNTNLEILTIFYSHIIRIFHYFVFIRILFAYFTNLFAAFILLLSYE